REPKTPGVLPPGGGWSAAVAALSLVSVRIRQQTGLVRNLTKNSVILQGDYPILLLMCKSSAPHDPFLPPRMDALRPGDGDLRRRLRPRSVPGDRVHGRGDRRHRSGSNGPS